MDLKKITIQDIAAHAKVSKSTVSRVLNNTTPVNEAKKKAVLEAVELLNFQPNYLASGLAGGQSMTIGVQTQKIGSPFYDSITHGIIQSLSDSRSSPVSCRDSDSSITGMSSRMGYASPLARHHSSCRSLR